MFVFGRGRSQCSFHGIGPPGGGAWFDAPIWFVVISLSGDSIEQGNSTLMCGNETYIGFVFHRAPRLPEHSKSSLAALALGKSLQVRLERIWELTTVQQSSFKFICKQKILHKKKKSPLDSFLQFSLINPYFSMSFNCQSSTMPPCIVAKR